MKRALIISRNLIGDMLMASIALREWYLVNKGNFEEIDLLTNNDHVTRLYYGIGIDWSNVFTSDDEVTSHIIAFSNDYDKGYTNIFELGAGAAGKICDETKSHIVDGFCRILNIAPPQVDIAETQFGRFKAYKPEYNPWRTLDYVENAIEEGLILFSPFSASCSSRKGDPPNKMLQPLHWIPIINYLRTLGPIRMLGAPDDMPHESWQLSEQEIFTGVRLDLLAAIMQKSKLVVTIDNGMGHLADSQDAKHILFYPMCLSFTFIISWGAKYTIPIQIDPASVQPAQLNYAFRRATKQLLGV